MSMKICDLTEYIQLKKQTLYVRSIRIDIGNLIWALDGCVHRPRTLNHKFCPAIARPTSIMTSEMVFVAVIPVLS